MSVIRFFDHVQMARRVQQRRAEQGRTVEVQVCLHLPESMPMHELLGHITNLAGAVNGRISRRNGVYHIDSQPIQEENS